MVVSNTYSVVLCVLFVVVLCLVYGYVQTHIVLCYFSCLSSSCVLFMVVSNTYSVVLCVLFVVVMCLVHGCVQHI
jgi:hypothetical protein